MPHPAHPPAQVAERALLAAFLAVLVWAPLPFGSNRPWAVALLCGVLATIAFLWCGLSLTGRVSFSRRVWQRGRWPLFLLLTINILVILQMLPLPGAVVGTLSPQAAALHTGQGWVPLSLDIASTRIYLLGSLACLLAFGLVLALVNTEKRARVLLWVLVISGLFQAVYGAVMVLTGLEWGFLVDKYVGKGVTTGTFVNRNHLAGYLVMSLALGTGLLISQLSTATSSSWRDFLRRSLRTLMSPKIFLRVFLALMVIALVMTRSRMGNSAFFISLAVAGVVAVVAGRKFSWKLALLLLSLLVIDTWIVGDWFGLDKVVGRLEKTTPAKEVRLKVSTDTTRILEDYWLVGAGGGSFGDVFTRYQGIDVKGRYDHAHNDYLELAADLGIPALILLVIFCVLVAIRAVRLQRPDHTSLQRGVGFALVMVLVWLALHSAVDFNLHIPANSVTLCAILALAFARLLPD